MNKHNSINNLLEKFKSLKNFEQVIVVDYWPSDQCAIGLSKDNKLIYISTFNFVGINDDLYDLDLEVIDDNDSSNSIVVKEFRGIAHLQLKMEIELFFLI